jgi:hypothetical protein
MPKQRGLLESPPALSPLEQGGRGYGSGGILPAKSPFGAPNKGGWCIPLSKTTQEKLFFEHPLADPLTNALEMDYNRNNEFCFHSSSSNGKRDGEWEDATSRNQAQGGEN